MVDCIRLTQDLITRPSVTPDDAGCLDLISEYLIPMGFTCYRLPFGDVDNMYARLGAESPNFCFAGHTDVVPVVFEELWKSPPFAADIHDGFIYGRGAVDMKGAIAAFVAAVSMHPLPIKGSISFLLTSDEEGKALNGTRQVVKWLQEQGETIDACIVGEPTSTTHIVDTVKVGRRGSLSVLLTVTGKAGHVAYPHLAANPIPVLLEYLQVVSTIILDEGMEHFQPSHLEVTTIDVDNLATNVIPRQAHARFNIRFNPLHTTDSLMELLKEQAAAIMEKHEGFECSWEWEVSGEAFLTNNIRLQNIIKEAIVKVRGVVPEFSTSGGTSDARFIKDLCPVVELGLTNETAHQLDERVSITHLKTLTKIYSQILHSFFETPPCPLCHSSL